MNNNNEGERKNNERNNNEGERKPYTILLMDSEVEWVRDYTKVDAVAPAVVAVIRKAKEAHEKGAM